MGLHLVCRKCSSNPGSPGEPPFEQPAGPSDAVAPGTPAAAVPTQCLSKQQEEMLGTKGICFLVFLAPLSPWLGGWGALVLGKDPQVGGSLLWGGWLSLIIKTTRNCLEG